VLLQYYFKDMRLNKSEEKTPRYVVRALKSTRVSKYTVKIITGSRPKMGLYPISETLEICYYLSVSHFINRCQKLLESH
jgi:hypothetical protein